MEKINLNIILEKEIIKIYGEFKNSNDFCQRDRIICKNAMKEVAKQTLQLAAENACGSHCTDYVDKQSILNVINLIE